MPSITAAPTGGLVFVQPRAEYILQKAAALGVAGLFIGLGLLFLVLPTNPPAAGLLVAAVFCAFGGLFGFLGARQRPYRLCEDGIQLPTGHFLAYGEVRDVQHIDSRRGRAKFLFLAFVDGTFRVIGTPMTNKVIFATREFDCVEALVMRGVQARGSRPSVEWDSEFWHRISSMKFRGPVIVNAEKAAREQGVRRIDEVFFDRAMGASKRLRWWLAAAAFATAKSAGQPNRNSTPRSPRG